MELHKSLEITNALIAVHVTSLPGSLYVCLHFATAHVPMHTDKLTWCYIFVQALHQYDTRNMQLAYSTILFSSY